MADTDQIWLEVTNVRIERGPSGTVFWAPAKRRSRGTRRRHRLATWNSCTRCSSRGISPPAPRILIMRY